MTDKIKYHPHAVAVLHKDEEIITTIKLLAEDLRRRVITPTGHTLEAYIAAVDGIKSTDEKNDGKKSGGRRSFVDTVLVGLGDPREHTERIALLENLYEQRQHPSRRFVLLTTLDKSKIDFLKPSISVVHEPFDIKIIEQHLQAQGPKTRRVSVANFALAVTPVRRM